MRVLVSARMRSTSLRRLPSPFMSRTRANFWRDSEKISSSWARCDSVGLRSCWMRLRNSCTAWPPACCGGASLGAFASSVPAGLKRSAALGTLSAAARLSTATRTLAVIPGRSARSGFAAEITTV